MKINSGKFIYNNYLKKVDKLNKNEEIKEIEIIHTNDLHANVIDEVDNTGLAYIGSYIKEKRESNPDVLYIDSGDFLSGGSFFSQMAKGMPVIKSLNKMKLDISTIGNHEFEFGIDDLKKALQKSKFNIISANIKSESLKDFIKPYKIIEKNGIKLGFIGLSPEELYTLVPDYNLGDVEILDDKNVLSKYLPEIRKKADVIILVSHSGVKKDKQLAKEFPDIDIILGGHSHTILKKPIKVGKTIIVQTGKSGMYIDDLLIKMDNTNHAYKIEHKLVDVKKLPLDKEIKDIYTKYVDKFKDKGNIYITSLDNNLNKRGDNQSQLGSVVADAIKDITKADVVLVQSGHIRKPLKKGKITYKDVFDVIPSMEQLSLFKVKGDIIYKLVEKSLLNRVSNPLQSSAFLQVSGIKVFYDDRKKPFSKVIKIIDEKGKVLDKNKFYTISGPYLLMKGQIFPEMKDAILVKENIIREDEALAKYLKKADLSNLDTKRYIEVEK